MRTRIAIVGCGDIAETGHLPALLAHPRFELCALCDIDRSRAERLASMCTNREIQVVKDHRTLVDDTGLDAVVLALHPEVSVDVAIAFLLAGKAVLDEKPLATTVTEGQRLAQAVAEATVPYQIGFVFRYAEAITKVRHYAEKIGRPADFRVRVRDERLDRDDPVHFAKIQGILAHSSAITHEGSHIIDYSQAWGFGEFSRVAVTADKTQADFNGPNVWHCEFADSRGTNLYVDIEWFLDADGEISLEVTGPGGRLALDLASGQGVFETADRSETLQMPPLCQEWHRQLDTFADAIDNGMATTATVDDGLRALRLSSHCEALYWQTPVQSELVHG